MTLFDGKAEAQNNSRAKKSRSPKQLENDVLAEALAKEFFPEGVGREDWKVIYMVVQNLKPKNAKPEEIPIRARRFEMLYPKAGPCTIHALSRNWDKCAPRKAAQQQHGYDDPVECEADRRKRIAANIELAKWEASIGHEKLAALEADMLATLPKYRNVYLKYVSQVRSTKAYTLRLWSQQPDHESFRKYR